MNELGWWTMAEKEMHEIGQMGRSKKQNRGGLKSRKVEEGIEKVRKGRGKWRMGSGNVETDG
jgi:hypothetical protein